MDQSSSVETLVYQLEDDDSHVRWDTIQRLRRRIAVEGSQFPLRNPRRFLHCLRRRLNDDTPQVVDANLLLLADVVDILRDDVDQILSSILPQLLPHLPSDTHGTLHEATFSVFRKYASVANDLPGVARLLVDMGLAHSSTSVREVVLVALIRLLDERYGRRVASGARRASTRVDHKLFVLLLQAMAPALEDADEGVVIAAEEAISKIRVLWGADGYQQAMGYLSGEDLATLHAHNEHIEEFIAVANGDVSVASSLSSSQVLKLRASLAVAPLSASLRFGFVSAEVITTLQNSTGNSNAEWKKRTAAVEQVYAAAKQVEATVLHDVILARGSDGLVTLIDLLLRLLHDIDVHLVKRSLQIQRLLFHKLQLLQLKSDSGFVTHFSQCLERVLPSLIEAAANFAEDNQLSSCIYGLLQLLFIGRVLSASYLLRMLLNSTRHRRLQIREEAFKVWIELLLTAHKESIPTDDVLDQKAIDALGRGVSDSSSRVRQVAMEVVVVLARVTGKDVAALLEHQLDDYTLERIDLDALDTRLRQRRCASLLDDGQVRLPELGSSRTAERDQMPPQTRSPVRVAPAAGKPLDACTRASNELLLGHSELQAVPMQYESLVKVRRSDKQLYEPPIDEYAHSNALGGRNSEGVRSNKDPWNQQLQRDSVTSSQRDVTSAPGEPIASKLEALKRKAQLKKSVSSKQMTTSRAGMSRGGMNPQEGHANSERVEEELTRPIARSKYSDRAEANKSLQLNLSARDGRGDGRDAFHASTLDPPLSPDERPIRPLQMSEQVYLPEYEEQPTEPSPAKTQPPATMSHATKKRLETKQRQEEEENQQRSDATLASPQHEASAVVREPETAPTRPISLATRKRLETKAKVESIQAVEDTTQAVPPQKRPAALGAATSGLGKQEPRYLEPHELLPLKDPKQEATKVLSQLRSSDWEANFDGLTVARRLAVHHSKAIEDKIHAIAVEILKHVLNLRSSVAKNALLALDSMGTSLGKLMDSEVESVVPVLMKRCTDSNSFVCESISASLRTVMLHCSTGRVVSAIAAHLSSRAIAIRKEVARCMHTVLVSLGDQVQASKELSSIVVVVGKALEDSNNEVRDAAKQSVIYLHQEQGMDGAKLKKLLPSSVHSKVDSVLTQRPLRQPTSKPAAMTKDSDDVRALGKAATDKKAQATVSRRPPAMGAEELDALTRRLGSSNWKDRFDALNPLVHFVSTYAVALCETGKVTVVIDSIVNRLEDGNAKVVMLMLELLPSIITSLGNGMEQVLSSFVPALSRGLASSNAKQVSLTQVAMQTLCRTVEARLLCQHITAVARHTNARIKPMLLEFLVELAAVDEDKNQYALTKYVLPLALDLLKEPKSEVKDVNARLLRTLYQSLGQSIFHSSLKLSEGLQDKLKAILGIR